MSTRMPYGAAKRIVAAMEIGAVRVVRPAWVVPMHNAARRMGVRVAAVSYREGDQLLYRVMRIGLDWPSGHRVCRWPARDHVSGQWRRKTV